MKGKRTNDTEKPKISVYTDKNGQCTAAVTLPRAKGEARKRKPFYGATEEEAERKAQRFIIDLEDGKVIVQTNETLIGFLKRYHQVHSGFDIWDPKAVPPKKAKWELTTSQLYKMYIDVHFEPYFKSKKLKSIITISLDEFYNYKMNTKRIQKVKVKDKVIEKSIDPLGINTVIKLNKFLSAAFNYAMANQLIKNNPVDGVTLSEPEEYEPTIYREDQFAELLDYVYGQDEEVPIILAGGCGYRRGEMCGLRWECINFETREITIENTSVNFVTNIEKKPKTKKSKRSTVAPEYVINVLERHYIAKGCPDKSEKVITRWKPKVLSEHFKLLLQKYKLEHIRLHDLRHYNAVLMMRYGVADKVAAERLGHANVQMLHQKYQHVIKDIDTSAADKINSSLEQSKQPKETPVLTREDRKAMFRVI